MAMEAAGTFGKLLVFMFFGSCPAGVGTVFPDVLILKKVIKLFKVCVGLICEYRVIQRILQISCLQPNPHNQTNCDSLGHN